MAHEGIPTASLTLAGETLALACTTGALRRIQRTSGHNLREVFDAQLVDVGGPVLWSLLESEDRKRLSVDDIEDRLPPDRLAEVFGTCITLILDAMPERTSDAGAAGEEDGAAEEGKAAA